MQDKKLRKKARKISDLLKETQHNKKKLALYNWTIIFAWFANWAYFQAQFLHYEFRDITFYFIDLIIE
jgi:hypothetical protein